MKFSITKRQPRERCHGVDEGTLQWSDRTGSPTAYNSSPLHFHRERNYCTLLTSSLIAALNNALLHLLHSPSTCFTDISSLSVCLYQSRFCCSLQLSLSGEYCIHCQQPSDAVVTLIVSDKLNNVWNSLHKDCYTDEQSTERGLLSSFMAGDVLWPFNWAGLLWYDGGLFILSADFISCQVSGSIGACTQRT